MADTIKFSSRPQYCHDVSWYPLSYRWPGVIFNQHFGLPPLLDPRDLSWMEGIFRRLGTSAWPGYLRSPALASFGQAAGQTISKLHREMSGGVSEVASEMCKWKISLDVNHFAPSDITVKIQDGFLEIAGKHEEREDEHGYIARSFTRKYNLPVGVDAGKIQTCVSADGILTVEAPLPSIQHPADVVIALQVELEAQSLEENQTDNLEPQGTFQPSAVPGEHLEGEAQERPGDQQIVSEISHAGEASAPSVIEQAAEVGEDENNIVVDTQRDGEDVHAEGAQAPGTPDTITSEQEEQAEVIEISQPQQSVGEEHTKPAVTADEQSTIGQTQEIVSPQQVLQKEIAPEKTEIAK